MTENDRLASELSDATARMRRLFRDAGRGGEHAVDMLDEIIRDVDRVALKLRPRPRSPAALASPGRATPGTITINGGRMIPVERRARRWHFRA